MLDFGIFEIRTDIFLLIVSVIFLLLQIFLCLKVKNVVLRLLPTAFFAVLTTVFAVMIFLVALDGEYGRFSKKVKSGKG